VYPATSQARLWRRDEREAAARLPSRSAGPLLSSRRASSRRWRSCRLSRRRWSASCVRTRAGPRPPDGRGAARPP
jgi:hypothetical protein